MVVSYCVFVCVWDIQEEAGKSKTNTIEQKSVLLLKRRRRKRMRAK